MLAPWEQVQYWQRVRETSILLPGLTWAVAAVNDPQRVGLWICPTDPVDILVSSIADGPTSRGIQIPFQARGFEIWHARHGPLVNLGWYAYSVAPTPVTIIEWSLAGWPSMTET